MKEPAWWKEVEEAIQERSLLRHPFYQAWQAGALSLDDLRYYARQYYPHVAWFPRYVSAVHSRTPDLKIRQMLLENLIEEERGENAHPELWLRFAEGLGLSCDEVLRSEIRPETGECVETFAALTQDSRPEVGLAALYAYESQIPAVSATKLDGLSRHYGISDSRTRAFFDVHQKADVWHSEAERSALQLCAQTEGAQRRVMESAKKACEAVWKLLDGVAEARGICAAC